MQIAQVHDAVPKKFMSFFHSPRENETRRQMTITYPEASNIAIPEASEGPQIWGVHSNRLSLSAYVLLSILGKSGFESGGAMAPWPLRFRRP